MIFENKIKELNITLPRAADPVGSYLATKDNRENAFYIRSNINVRERRIN